MEYLSEERALKIIESTGAVRTGHFVLTSGKHSQRYINKDDVSVHPRDLADLAQNISLHFWEADVQVVAAPAVGAVVLGNRVAQHCDPRHHSVLAVYAELDGDVFKFRRGYDRFIPGKRVLVVEDIITTGKTTKAMISSVEALGGQVVGVGLLWNRGIEEFSIPVFACVTKVFTTYEQFECSLCREGVKISIDVGHGNSFLKEFGEDPNNWPANKKS